MALILKDRVKETSSTAGAGTLDLDGAVAGFEGFVSAVGNGNVCYYAIQDANGTDWEVGVGTITDATPDTLARNTILASSNADSVVTLSAGEHTVFLTYPADKSVYRNTNDQIVVTASGIVFSDDTVQTTAPVDTNTTYTAGTGLLLSGTEFHVSGVDTSLLQGTISTAQIANDAIDSEHYAAGSIDLEHMSSQSVDEDNLHISNAGSNGQFLSKQSGNDGGLTWATPTDTNTTYTAGIGLQLASTTFNVEDDYLRNDASDTTTGTITAGGFSTTGVITVGQAFKSNNKSNSDGGTITFDLDVSNFHTVTLGGNRTLALSNADAGQKFAIRLQQDATGGRTVTWFSTIKWPDGVAPTLSSNGNKADLFGFVCTSAGQYDGFGIGYNL